MMACGLTLSDSLSFMTGVAGKETQLNWIVGTAPPPPSLRVVDYSRDGVELYWDNFSETVPDVKTLIFDFEGYRVWRADNWTRPLGSSADNGPGAELWKLLFEIDVVNNFGEDTGLDKYRYEPLVYKYPAAKVRDWVESIKTQLVEHPGANPPCIQGVTEAECDTIEAMAKHELGLDGGRRYYRFVDTSMHRGRPYFYSVTAMDHDVADSGAFRTGKAGDPSSNFLFIEPSTAAQVDYSYDENDVYVVPNPATTESMAAWALEPNNDDPTGIKVEFRNLPASRGTIRIYTVSGDLVIQLPFDGTAGVGTIEWDLVSRNLQDVTSGVYMYSVESEDSNFKRKIGKFVVIR
jgi:hypothetical protein